MPHERHGAGQPVVVTNRASTSVGVFPGAMIAPADATRRWLFIQASGVQVVLLYVRSGSDPAVEQGISIYPYAGSITLSDEDDPDLVIAEWWGFSWNPEPALVTVVEEIFR